MIIAAGGGDEKFLILRGISTINGVVPGAEVDGMGAGGQGEVIIAITSVDVRTTFDGVVAIAGIASVCGRGACVPSTGSSLIPAGLCLVLGRTR